MSSPAIHYLSHHDHCGYGVAARRLVLGLEAQGCRVRWTPIRWDQREPFVGADTRSTVGLDRLRRVDIEPDVVIVHSIPELLPALEHVRPPGVPLVLHTVWEHDVLQPHWADLINRCDAVIVPTEWNAGVFRSSGISVPVIEVPHAHERDLTEPASTWLDLAVPDDPDILRLHSVATWSLRKSPWTTLAAYSRAFTKADDVVLAMKTSSHLDDDVAPPAGPAHRRTLTSWSVAQIMSRNAPAPSLHLITESISFAQLAGLHHRSGGWISLPRSEGWDLGCFDAAVAGCPVITTGHGGPLAYLDPDLSVLIPGRRVELDWLPGAHWIEADLDAAIDALRTLRADPLAARARAERQALQLRSRYAPRVVASTLLSALNAAGILTAESTSS